MRNMQYLTSKHRIGITTPAKREQRADTSEDLVAAAVDALNEMGNITAHQCFTHPETLTEDRITAYALALMRLRECASTAGFDRLVNACDALAETVARLIEDRSCICREKCEALTRFVGHAKTMIQMSIERAKRRTLPDPEIHTPSDRVTVERTVHASISTQLSAVRRRSYPARFDCLPISADTGISDTTSSIASASRPGNIGSKPSRHSSPMVLATPKPEPGTATRSSGTRLRGARVIPVPFRINRKASSSRSARTVTRSVTPAAFNCARPTASSSQVDRCTNGYAPKSRTEMGPDVCASGWSGATTATRGSRHNTRALAARSLTFVQPKSIRAWASHPATRSGEASQTSSRTLGVCFATA